MRPTRSLALLFAAMLFACSSSQSDPAASAGTGGSAGTTTGTGGSAANGSSGNGSSGNGSSGSAGTSSAGTTGAAGSTGGGAGGAAGASSAGGAGTAGDGGNAGSGNVPFRGLAFYEPYGGDYDCADLTTLDVSWYYNWTTGSECQDAAEFVPHVARDWNVETWIDTPAEVAARGFDVVLGFNEPDHADQANMTVSEALALWPEFDRPELRVGSPATASDGQAWFEEFMDGVEEQGLRVDFVAIHWYGWNAGSCDDIAAFEAYIEWAEQWQRPIWITEWSCRQQGAEVTQAFYDDAAAMFQDHPLVERYAWYLSRSSGDFSGASLLDTAGALTALGQSYAADPAFK